MADSLLFDGTDDTITLALGGIPTFGPGTIGFAFKHGASGGPHSLYSPDTDLEFYVGSGNTLDFYNGAVINGPAITAGNWYVAFIRKATGTVTPSWSLYTEGSGWSSGTFSGTSANVALSGTPKIGSYHDSTEDWNGNILVGAVWSTELAHGTITAAGFEAGLAAWVNSTPVEGWRFDSMSAVASFGTTGTADETSRTGTSVDTGDTLSGWTDDLAAAAQQVNTRAFNPIPLLN